MRDLVNVIDLAAVLVLAYNVVRGLSTGLVRSGVNLLGMVLATAAMVHLPPWAAAWADAVPLPGVLAELVRPTMVWILVFVAVSSAGMALRALLRSGPLVILDRVGGALLGLGVGGVLLVMPLLMLSGLPLLQQVPQIQGALAGSFVATSLTPVVSKLLAPNPVPKGS